MRKALLVVVGIGIAALTLSGCAPASSGGGSASGGGTSGGSGAPVGASASMPTGKIDVCSALTVAAMSTAAGKKFGETLANHSDGVYSCLYDLSDGSGDWIVAVREPSDGDTPNNDALDLGGPAAVKSISGTGYPSVGNKAGVSLQVGKDVVEVYTPATASNAQGTQAEFVAVAKATIAAVSK